MFRKILSACMISSLFLAAFCVPVSASKGAPNSSSFGYGISIDPNGVDPQNAFLTADQIGLDWGAIPLDWAILQPEQNTEPDWSSLDELIHQGAEKQISILIQIQNAPVWALQAEGPIAELVATLMENLAGRYWPSVQAVELFPYPNTAEAWGAVPNARHYVHLLSTIKQRLIEKHCNLYLVSGSLAAFPTGNQDLPANQFLSQLYEAGLAQNTDIIGLAIPYSPQQQNAASTMPLQVIESARKVMLAYRHSQGTLWITHIEFPSGTISNNDGAFSQLCSQIRSHLYIGTLFFGTMNEKTAGQANMIREENDIRSSASLLATLQKLVEINNSGDPAAGT